MLTAILTSWVTALLAPLSQRFLPRLTGWLCAAVPLALLAGFAARITAVANGTTLCEQYDWIPSLGIDLTFRLDGLSLLFSLLISGIGVLIFVYASSYLHGHRHLGRFYGLMSGFMAAMLGTVLAGDLITLFVFWELTGLCSFLLIGFEHEQFGSRWAALQALLVTGAGGLALLAGFILLGDAAGSMDLAVILHSGGTLRASPLYLPILLLILAGAFTKSAQFPCHFWLPGAMAAPTPVSAYLHSATMVKLGIFLLARLTPALGGSSAWLLCLCLTGGITMLVGGITALLRHDLKQILAWSTVSALGILTLLLGLGTPLAITAAMTFLLAHALYKSALFLCAGAIDHGSGSRDITRLGGLARTMPQVAAAAVLAALAMAGLPPLGGFIAKELLYDATLNTPGNSPLTTAISLLGNGAAVAVALLAGYLPFFGRNHDPSLHPHPVETRLWLPPLIPALMGLLTGIVPGYAGRLFVGPAASAVHGSAVTADLALWHGLNSAFVLSLLTLVTGLALAAARRPLCERMINTGRGSRLSAEHLYDRLLDAVTGASSRLTTLMQNGRLRYYVMMVVGGTVVLTGYALTANVGMPSPLPRPDGALHEWLTAAVILAGAVMATVTTSRLAAVAALGTVGYGVALIYIIFGAPDLAMTQFCIETLSIILFVLVLHRLPRFTLLSPPVSRLRDLSVSLVIGALMTLLALYAVSQPLTPSISRWFLEQGLPSGHGRNVVNVILVDFRALDTLGEITVLAVAALGVYGLLKPGTGEGR
jgi:multicomponent Na+:H+ antiporter subunit A